MISVCIIVKNGARTLATTLASLSSFSEVVLCDTGSTDTTLEIARSYPNVRIETLPFTGFGTLRNQVAALAQGDWVFMVDADEVVSPALLEEIFAKPLDPQYAYSMPRHNFYRGKRIRGCGWAPDRVIRLYHKQYARYRDDFVHESVEASNVFPLPSPLLHTPYLAISDFLTKMELYTSLFANKQHAKVSFAKAFGKASFAFFRSYFLRFGFLDGTEGIEISLYNATTTLYKYLKVREKGER